MLARRISGIEMSRGSARRPTRTVERGSRATTSFMEEITPGLRERLPLVLEERPELDGFRFLCLDLEREAPAAGHGVLERILLDELAVRADRDDGLHVR